MHEHARWSLIYVLGDGDETDVGCSQGGMDDRVIETIACEAIDFVDDAVLHGVVGDVVEHLLEGTPSNRFG